METLANPWFIGVATSVIGGILLYYGFRTVKAKTRNPNSNFKDGTEENLTVSSPAGNEKEINKLLPKDIVQYLRSLPPFQKESAGKNYEGIKVAWEVNLQYTTQISKGNQLLIMFHKGKPPSVSCVVDVGHYPELKIIKQDQDFIIEGEIKSAREAGIELTNCRFRF